MRRMNQTRGVIISNDLNDTTIHNLPLFTVQHIGRQTLIEWVPIFSGTAQEMHILSGLCKKYTQQLLNHSPVPRKSWASTDIPYRTNSKNTALKDSHPVPQMRKYTASLQQPRSRQIYVILSLRHVT